MSWNFTLDFTTATPEGRRNIVRQNIGAWDDQRQHLSDEVIEYYLSSNGNNINRATILGLEALLAAYLTRPDEQDVGKVHLRWEKQVEKFQALIAQWDKKLLSGARPYAGGISEAANKVFDDDTDISPAVFSMDTGRSTENPLRNARSVDEDG